MKPDCPAARFCRQNVTTMFTAADVMKAMRERNAEVETVLAEAVETLRHVVLSDGSGDPDYRAYAMRRARKITGMET